MLQRATSEISPRNSPINLDINALWVNVQILPPRHRLQPAWPGERSSLVKPRRRQADGIFAVLFNPDQPPPIEIKKPPPHWLQRRCGQPIFQLRVRPCRARPKASAWLFP
jgi:hypothetical protein